MSEEGKLQRYDHVPPLSFFIYAPLHLHHHVRKPGNIKKRVKYHGRGIKFLLFFR